MRKSFLISHLSSQTTLGLVLSQMIAFDDTTNRLNRGKFVVQGANQCASHLFRRNRSDPHFMHSHGPMGL